MHEFKNNLRDQLKVQTFAVRSLSPRWAAGTRDWEVSVNTPT
jgi:hypothetical protein